MKGKLMPRFLGREPAFWANVFAAVVMVATAFGLDLSTPQQVGLNAGATALAGLVVAWSVSEEKALAAVSHFLVALAQVLVAFGLDVSEGQVTAVSALLALILPFWLRDRVSAPVDKLGLPQ